MLVQVLRQVVILVVQVPVKARQVLVRREVMGVRARARQVAMWMVQMLVLQVLLEAKRM
jgi:hypothetical protein